jgi:hypothetical protein
VEVGRNEKLAVNKNVCHFMKNSGHKELKNEKYHCSIIAVLLLILLAGCEDLGGVEIWGHGGRGHEGGGHEDDFSGHPSKSSDHLSPMMHSQDR